MSRPEPTGHSEDGLRRWGGRNVPTAAAPATTAPMTASKTPTHLCSPGARHGRIAAIPIAAAIARGTIQSQAIVIGNTIRNIIAPAAQAAGHKGKSDRSRGVRSCRSDTSVTIDSPRAHRWRYAVRPEARVLDPESAR